MFDHWFILKLLLVIRKRIKIFLIISALKNKFTKIVKAKYAFGVSNGMTTPHLVLLVVGVGT